MVKLTKYQKEALFLAGYFNDQGRCYFVIDNPKDLDIINYAAKRIEKLTLIKHTICPKCGSKYVSFLPEEYYQCLSCGDSFPFGG